MKKRGCCRYRSREKENKRERERVCRGEVGHDDGGVGEREGGEGGCGRLRGLVARASVRRGALIYAAGARRGCLQGGRAGANNSLASGSRNHPLLWFFHRHPLELSPPALLRLLTASIENVAIVTAKSRGSPVSAKRRSCLRVTLSSWWHWFDEEVDLVTWDENNFFSFVNINRTKRQSTCFKYWTFNCIIRLYIICAKGSHGKFITILTKNTIDCWDISILI